MDRQSQRILLGLTSETEDEEEYSEEFIAGELLLAVIGAVCLIYVVLMCTCKESKSGETKDVELLQISANTDKESLIFQNGENAKSKTTEESAIGGAAGVSSGHFHGQNQLDSSDAVQLRPSSTRILPTHLQRSTRVPPALPPRGTRVRSSLLSSSTGFLPALPRRGTRVHSSLPLSRTGFLQAFPRRGTRVRSSLPSSSSGFLQAFPPRCTRVLSALPSSSTVFLPAIPPRGTRVLSAYPSGTRALPPVPAHPPPSPPISIRLPQNNLLSRSKHTEDDEDEEPHYAIPNDEEEYDLPNDEEEYDLPNDEEEYDLPNDEEEYDLPNDEDVYDLPKDVVEYACFDEEAEYVCFGEEAEETPKPMNSMTAKSQNHQDSSVTGHVRPAGGVRVLPAPPDRPPPPVCPPPPISNSLSQNSLLSTPEQTVDDEDEEADYDYPEQAEETHHKSKGPASPSGAGGRERKTQSHIYDHLGVKPSVKPSDYDTLGELHNRSADASRSIADEESDNDYSEVEEKMDPVIIDVRPKKKELSAPFTKMDGEGDGSTDYHIQVRDEDPYNRIWESGEVVSSSLVQQLQQSSESDDPYATVDEGSAGDDQSALGAARDVKNSVLHKIMPVLHYFPDTSPTSRDVGATLEEYAVVQKGNRMPKHIAENYDASSKDHTVSQPETPVLPSVCSVNENPSAGELSLKNKKKHNYSKVTARESLASMSARMSQNPYDMVADMSENAYSMVEGWSEDGSEPVGAVGGTKERRLSQISETYAEIGISGASLNSQTNISSSNPEHSNINNTSSFTPFTSSVDSSKVTTSECGDSAGSYVTLKEDLYRLSAPSGDSEAVPFPFGNQIITGGDLNSRDVERIESYPDYDNLDDMTAKVASTTDLQPDAAADPSGNKKIGQRRQRLDHN